MNSTTLATKEHQILFVHLRLTSNHL